MKLANLRCPAGSWIKMKDIRSGAIHYGIIQEKRAGLSVNFRCCGGGNVYLSEVENAFYVTYATDEELVLARITGVVKESTATDLVPVDPEVTGYQHYLAGGNS